MVISIPMKIAIMLQLNHNVMVGEKIVIIIASAPVGIITSMKENNAIPHPMDNVQIIASVSIDQPIAHMTGYAITFVCANMDPNQKM